MGMVEWFKKTFGKQPCAFCGAEVGMLKRTKIKDKSFICNECSCGCSRYIQRYRYTKDELLGHMEYMKRQGSLYAQLEGSSDNPMELFKLKDVQTLLSSAEFFPAQEAEATN